MTASKKSRAPPSFDWTDAALGGWTKRPPKHIVAARPDLGAAWDEYKRRLAAVQADFRKAARGLRIIRAKSNPNEGTIAFARGQLFIEASRRHAVRGAARKFGAKGGKARAQLKRETSAANAREAARLRADGWPVPRIAKRLGVSKSTVYAWLAKVSRKNKVSS